MRDSRSSASDNDWRGRPRSIHRLSRAVRTILPARRSVNHRCGFGHIGCGRDRRRRLPVGPADYALLEWRTSLQSPGRRRSWRGIERGDRRLARRCDRRVACPADCLPAAAVTRAACPSHIRVFIELRTTHGQRAAIAVNPFRALRAPGLFLHADGADLRAREFSHALRCDSSIVGLALAAGFPVVVRPGVIVNVHRAAVGQTILVRPWRTECPPRNKRV